MERTDDRCEVTAVGNYPSDRGPRKAKVSRSVVMAAAFVVALVSNALGQTPCMSDKELSAFLREITVTSMGYGLGVCKRKYPDELSGTVDAILKRANDVHRRAFERNLEESSRPFRRAFGKDRGEAEHQEAITRAVQIGVPQYEAFEIKECRNHIAGLDVLLDLGAKTPSSDRMTKALDSFIAMFWSKERAGAARCE